MNYIGLRTIGLIIALLTMQSYVYKGAYSKTHRLLPVLMTCNCLYNFYELVLAMTGAGSVFLLLEQLLLIQIIYIFFHYIMDVIHYKIKGWMEVLCFISLIIGDWSTFSMNYHPKTLYKGMYDIFSIGYLLAIFVISIYTVLQSRIRSRRERFIVNMIYLAYLPVAIAIPFRGRFQYGVPLLSGALILCCFVMLYLIQKGYLVDMSLELKSSIYADNRMPTILLDSNLNFLDANNAAKKLVSGKDFQKAVQSLLSYAESGDVLNMQEVFYKCVLDAISFSVSEHGHKLTLIDVTDERKQLQTAEEQRQLAEENALMKSKMLSMESHEMRTPLNAIISLSSHLLARREITGKIREQIGYIKAAGNELLVHIEMILQYSKAEIGFENKENDIDMLKQEKEKLLQELDKGNEDVSPYYIYPDARVLLAEDMQVNQIIFREIVEPWEFKLDIVENGQQALEAIQKYNYQMVFLDKMMPVMDGIEAAKQISQIRDTPLVVITADTSDDLKNRYKEYGFSAFLAKPLNLAEVKDAIETYIHKGFRQWPKTDDYFGSSPQNSGIYEVYRNELAEIKEQLRELRETDLSLFRTKVHGIKSTSKQLGIMELGEQAEILEMAAKTDNINFIDNHIDSFLEACEQIIQQLEQ